MQLVVHLRFWKPIGMSGCPLICLCLAVAGNGSAITGQSSHHSQWRLLDAWTIFDDSVENADLGLWLERVLHTPQCDARDLLKLPDDGFTDHSGMWDASLRLAYCCCC